MMRFVKTFSVETQCAACGHGGGALGRDPGGISVAAGDPPGAEQIPSTRTFGGREIVEPFSWFDYVRIEKGQDYELLAQRHRKNWGRPTREDGRKENGRHTRRIT